jgi:hypothetical protein
MGNLVVKIEGASKYSFTDDKTNRLVEGVNVFYLHNKNSEHSVGLIPQKITLPFDSWGYVKDLSFPVSAEIITEQQLGSKGVFNKVVGVKPIK